MKKNLIQDSDTDSDDFQRQLGSRDDIRLAVVMRERESLVWLPGF